MKLFQPETFRDGTRSDGLWGLFNMCSWRKAVLVKTIVCCVSDAEYFHGYTYKHLLFKSHDLHATQAFFPPILPSSILYVNSPCGAELIASIFTSRSGSAHHPVISIYTALHLSIPTSIHHPLLTMMAITSQCLDYSLIILEMFTRSTGVLTHGKTTQSLHDIQSQ